MWDYLICSLKTSGILKTYFFHLIDLFYTWIEYLDPVILRFVPIIWIFWTFIWALLSKDFDYKKDFLKIFIWNLLFVIFNISFWVILRHFCWFFPELF